MLSIFANNQTLNAAELESQIKETFYNLVANDVFNQEEVTLQTIDRQLMAGIKNTFVQIISIYHGCNGIKLPNGAVITQMNCPAIYAPLFAELLRLKNIDLNTHEIDGVIARIIGLESFRSLNLKQFVISALGLNCVPVSRDDETNVTADLIRRTFYEEMVAQAFLATEEGWLSYELFEELNDRIFFTLPALTILQAAIHSQNFNGILLLDNKIVNSHNCPRTENFPELVQLTLNMKETVSSLTVDQCRAIKHLLSCETPLPLALQPLQTHELMQFVSTINDMAIQVSQRQYFRNMVGLVITKCMEILQPSMNTPGI